MSYISDYKVPPIALFGTSTDESIESIVGARFETSDGRSFAIVQNAGTALAAGYLVQGPAAIANHQGLTVTAFTPAAVAQAGSAPYNPPAQNSSQAAIVTVTLGGTAATANQYAGGFLEVQTGAGIGQFLKIASHPAQTSTSGSLAITLEDAPVTALTTSSTVGLRLNSFGSPNGTDVRTSGVIVTPTTLTGRIIGASVYAIPASTTTVPSYGFIQTYGSCALVNHGGTTIGHDLGNSTQSTPVAGATETYVVANNVRIGVAIQAATDTQASAVFLQL